MAVDKKELEILVLRKFRIIYGAVKSHFKQIEKECGISSSQLWILKIIKNNPGICLNDVAQKVSIHQTTASILVEKLAKKKLIEKTRSTEDQRKIVLFSNAKGDGLVNKAPASVEGLLPNALTNLSSSTLNRLSEDLETIITEFDDEYQKLADVPLADL